METKEKILLVAFKLFVNNGYHNTSMQQLVNASELSKGAFYHYFKSKNELYKQVINRYFLSFYLDINWSSYNKTELTTKEIEIEIQNFYLNFIPQILSVTQNGLSEYYIMYFEAFSILPEFKITVQEFYRNLELLLIKAVDNIENPNKMATTIIAKYEGILFLLAINPSLEINALLNRITE